MCICKGCVSLAAAVVSLQVLQDKDFEAKVMARTPMGRIAQPSEVGHTTDVQILLGQG